MRLAAILAVLLFATAYAPSNGGAEPSERIEKSLDKLQAEALKGSADAQASLGFKYLNGDGVATNCRTAMKYLREAAGQGEVTSQVGLGVVRRDGCTTPRMKSATVSLEWFRMAAEQGNAAGQYNVGVAYLNGDVVDQDYVAAMTWFQLAADQEYPEAEFRVGNLYEQGVGLLQDYVEAERWYRYSAMHGYIPAQARLGTLQAIGPKAIVDLTKAYIWLSVAVASSDTSVSELRDEVAKTFSRASYIETQKLAAEYFEKYKAK